MRNLLPAVAALAVTATLAAPASAGPPAPGPLALCGLVAVTDPGTAGGDILTGVVFGAALGTGTLTCTVQVGASTHSSSDAAVVGAWGSPAVIPPTVVSFVSPVDVPIYLCAQWADINGTSYWHDAGDGEGGHWTTDSNKPCSLAIDLDLHDVAGPVLEASALLACPLLAWVLPPDGDVPGVWDCPPYSDGGVLGGQRVVIGIVVTASARAQADGERRAAVVMGAGLVAAVAAHRTPPPAPSVGVGGNAGMARMGT